MSDISVRIDQVKSNIRDASNKVNRNPEEVLLLGVTKTVDVDVIEGSKTKDLLILEDELKAVAGNLYITTVSMD